MSLKLDAFSSIEFKYKGKRYRIWKIKEEQKVIPVGEVYNNDKESRKKEIRVKDYNVGKWNVTVNVNGETIIVGWGPIKHLTFWGSIVFLVIVVIYLIRHYLNKMEEARWRRIKNWHKNKNKV